MCYVIMWIFKWILYLYYTGSSLADESVLQDKHPPTMTKDLPLGLQFFSNATVTITCPIEGAPIPKYQWYGSVTELQDTSTIEEVKFEKEIYGDKKTYTIDGRLPGNNYHRKVYFCSAQNSLGTLHSNKVIVENVKPLPHVTIKYTKMEVYQGEKYIISCYTQPELTRKYFKFKRWELRISSSSVKELEKTTGRYRVITSTEIPQLHITSITKADFSSAVRCIFQSTVDNQIFYGSYNNIAECNYNTTDVMISESKETINVQARTNIELPWCTFPRTIDVTWFKVIHEDVKVAVGNNPKDTKYDLVQQKNGNLLIFNISKQDSGIYQAGNKSGKMATFTLNVYDPASIYLSPEKIVTQLQHEATFVCSVTYSRAKFYWLHNGKRIDSKSNINITNNYNESRLHIQLINLKNFGVYQCVALAEDDQLKSLSEHRQISGTLLISEFPPILLQQKPAAEHDSAVAQIQISESGDGSSIGCIFAGNPKPHVVWYLNNERINITDVFILINEDDPNSVYNVITNLSIDPFKFKHVNNKRGYSGQYKAVAKNSLGTAECKTFALNDGPLELRLPNKQEALAGKNYLLSCYFAAMGVPTFSWDRRIKDGTWQILPINHRTTMLDKNHKILLTLVEESDEGSYRCNATFNMEKQSQITELRVAHPPYLSKPQFVVVDIGKDSFHVCRIKNKADRPWYVWWSFTKYGTNVKYDLKPNQNEFPEFQVTYNFLKSSDSLRNSVPVDGVPNFLSQLANGEVNLAINRQGKNSNDLSVGKFTCHVKNHKGADEFSMVDSYLRLEFKIKPPESTEVIVGKSLNLNCAPKENDLKPIVNWKIYHSSELKYIDINDLKDHYQDRIFYYKNGTLVIKNIKETDPSKFYCFINITSQRKNFPEQSTVAYIDIRIPAKVLKMDPVIEKVYGTAFNLSCFIYGDTYDLFVTLEYRENHNKQWKELLTTCVNSPVNPCINRYQYTTAPVYIHKPHNLTYNEIIFQYSNARDSMAGDYKCDAKNKFSSQTDSAITSLIIISRPSKMIINPSDNYAKSTSLSIQLTAPSKNGFKPILEYVIKYSEISNGILKDSEKVIKVNHSVDTLIIDKLRPNRNFRITAFARNIVGNGEPTTIDVATQEARPETPVRNLKGGSNKPGEISVSWDEPDTDFQNGRITSYQVCYQVITQNEETHLNRLNWPDEIEGSVSPSNVQCTNVLDKEKTISGLTQFTDFAVRVIAINSKGGSPSVVIKVRTMEDLPNGPPSGVNCQPGNLMIHLQWNAPKRETLNGVLKGYSVQYHAAYQLGDESEMLSVLVQGKTEVTLENLQPATSYYIEVMAVNRKGFGPPSNTVICTTAEAKPEEPEQVKAMRISVTCISVSWLHCIRKNGNILEYCVSAMGYDSFERPKRCQPPNFNKRYNYMTYCDDAYISRVKVWARNTYEGGFRESVKIDENPGIVSFGSNINLKHGESIMLPCEYSNGSKKPGWRRDQQELPSSEYPNIKILENNSLSIIAGDRFLSTIFTCYTLYDFIEYNVNVQEKTSGFPRSPIISEYFSTENSVFISWKSRGTTESVAPITGFILTWKNIYTGDTKTVNIEAPVRTFYLNNATCASDYTFTIKSANSNGQSEYSDIKTVRTQGTAPLFADNNVLLPKANVKSHDVYFNLMAFLPGENCSATSFRILITFEGTGNNYDNLAFNKSITIYDLQNKCCYNATGLQPLTVYRYQVIAFNPAGSTPSGGVFKTVDIGGSRPDSGRIKEPDNVIHPWLLTTVFVVIVFLVLVVVIFAVLYFLRSKKDKSYSVATTVPVRRPEYNKQPTQRDEDNTSLESNGEPSPYAVYQPDNDTKTQIYPPQMSQTNATATPSYNYTDQYNHYNQIKYDYRNPPNNIRRANSAECLSSNASVSGVGDLESPMNLVENDEILQNIQYPTFSTLRKSRGGRRESDGAGPSGDYGTRQYDPTSSKNDIYNRSVMNYQQRPSYRQQTSVPDHSTTNYQIQYRNPPNRIRSQSGVGLRQLPQKAFSNQQHQTNYNGYYGTRPVQQAYPNNYGSRAENKALVSDPRKVNYSYFSGSNLSNYTTQSRNGINRQSSHTGDSTRRESQNESTDEGIYTDRVIIV